MHRRKFIEWLGFHPTVEEITRALATEYLAQFGILGIRIVRTTAMTQFSSWANMVIPALINTAIELFQALNGEPLIPPTYTSSQGPPFRHGVQIHPSMSLACVIEAFPRVTSSLNSISRWRREKRVKLQRLSTILPRSSPSTFLLAPALWAL